MEISPGLHARLQGTTSTLDQSGDWPAEQLAWINDEGISKWAIPAAYGGMELTQTKLIEGYESLSAACMTTAFIMTQRNGACQRIASSPNEELKRRLLPDLAQGTTFATVGISHLTTSQQHLRTPAVQVKFDGDNLILNGGIPWVTGAAYAEHIVTGGTCPDGEQVLIALPTNIPGVQVQPHSQLMAFTESHTARVALNHVVLSRSHLIAGPTSDIMTKGVGGGTGSQTTSALALGLTRSSLHLIREQATTRTEFQEIASAFEHEFEEIRGQLYASLSFPSTSVDIDSSPWSAAQIRQRANSLALRVTQASLAITKGAGYVRGHPAELAVRQAMFFLVWSCPQHVVQEFLKESAFRKV
ncbi:acyl-CoA dehydrogenase family protein [Planctomicrobium sp. SH668]|uniref:acyl-CoA dehydrogenase family protein n=1 Tax=Planctomicrobium sp. SH668 TaxID=3448126 RepID=UPI003F5C04CA